jgi:signal transduction histidine kinase
MKSAVRMDVGKPARESRALHPVPARAPAPASVLASSNLKSSNLESVVAEAAHDLNNTFGSIRLHLDLLELEANYPRRVRQRLLEIRYALDHVADISRTLRHPAGDGPEDFDPIPKIALNPVLRRMLPLMSAMVPKQVALQIHLAPKLHAVTIEPVDLVRIVSNLMLNSVVALRAVPHVKGKVTVETANADTPGWVLVGVRDNGPGMPAAIQAKMMQPFVPATGSEEHGVGLPSVLRLVRRAGGTLQIESAPGQGTAITILFPAAASSQTGPKMIGRKTPGPKLTPPKSGPQRSSK